MQQLAELDPADYQQLNNMAWVYATATDPQFRDAPKAIDLAQQALVISPYNHHIWSTLSKPISLTATISALMPAYDKSLPLPPRRGSK